MKSRFAKSPPVMMLPIMAAGLLTSCDPSADPGMVEKVSLLEAELRERDRQITALQEEVDAASEAATKPSTSAPDLDAARTSYLEFIEVFGRELAGAMPDAKFDRTSVFPVIGPDPSKPITSRVAYRIVNKDGRTGELVIPLFASPSGKWEKPETAEVIASFKAKPAPQETASVPTPAAPAPSPPQRSQPTDVMGANRTIEVQWDDGQTPAAPKPAPQANANPAPPPQPAPSEKPAVPKKVMPTSRDVIIDFE